MKRTESKPLFPLFTDISGYKIVIVGGGSVALRRVRTLLSFASDLTVVAPKVRPELEKLAEAGRVRLERRPYRREDLYAAQLVLAATDDRQVNEDVYSACKGLRILVNVASDRRKCDFQFPSVVLKDEISVGITGNGENHRQVKETRKKLEAYLGGEQIYGE